ncbi:MAG: hypothetical protein JW880_00275 [Candidatus Thermoplasmatota archaeon]|nr:hypothetical protein [Candidatus Thermoplasmatota archaeon]
MHDCDHNPQSTGGGALDAQSLEDGAGRRSSIMPWLAPVLAIVAFLGFVASLVLLPV